jgi:hypothetical protein
MFAKLQGIIGGALQYGIGGPRLKANGGTLEARTPDDGGLGPFAADYRNLRMAAGYSDRLWPDHPNSTTLSAMYTLAADTLYAVPHKIGYDLAMQSLSVLVTSAIAGAHLRMGLYAVGSNGAPGDLLAQTAEQSGAVAAEITGSIAATQPKAPWVYVAILADAGIQVRGAFVPRCNPLAAVGGGGVSTFLHTAYAAQAYGNLPAAFPSSFTGIASNAAAGPFICPRST